MIKLIASDLDGTLLKEDGSISTATVEAIRKAEASGILFMAATGRSYLSAKKAIEKAGLNVPILCMNGANVYDEHHQRIIDTPLHPEMAKEIIEKVDTNKVYLEMYTNKGVFAPDQAQFIDMLLNILREKFIDYTDEQIKAYIDQRFQEETFSFTDDFLSVLNDDAIIPYKLLAFSLKKSELAAIRSIFDGRKDLYVTSSGFDNVEFNHHEATKGHALLTYAKKLGIKPEEIMAIGDNENDLPMLTKVGYGVAMDNATDYIKSHVDYTTTSNNKDGVKSAIEMALAINEKN
ncbi:hypothetical protein GCM10012290_22150 [Halolactibacillus alkaliphilus]|uniref:Haloacid dehalogenase n=1 Tax=Halolactibacillus alkaliphilus TaxID=442899 RepID=A0A511X3Y2_9BACI|nr:Cof-type HAD-IIB family hydrolase [Halolactibacillus alkaliphilus]GEN57615.1 hypothetical protein HAL01_20790 [Halolactibacillus alkaliphilus]GGN74376.1 hypothetical protein GCM10012290_22150 [Halolactibacillus alkaliphilus]SFP01299.1 hypothetical protein SAMN05720591_13219 [Halolactibacillus alkaliphilus]